jgi:hypothetical protein
MTLTSVPGCLADNKRRQDVRFGSLADLSGTAKEVCLQERTRLAPSRFVPEPDIRPLAC